MTVVNVNGFEWYIDAKLLVKWDKIKNGRLAKEDSDRVYIVDGRERSGKSLFTIQQAAYIDPTIVQELPNLPRICFSAEELLAAIRSTNSDRENTRVIIFDEAYNGLSSAGSLSKENRNIKQALMEMGQKNLVLFIVLPSFFMLDYYAAVARSLALFHIKKKKGSNVRTFRAYNEKRKFDLHLLGMKKAWKYPFSKFNGEFYNKYPGGEEFEKAYRAKKLRVLEADPVKAAASAPQAGAPAVKSEKPKYVIMGEEYIRLKAAGLDISYEKLGKMYNISREAAFFAVKKYKNSLNLTDKTVNVNELLVNI